MLKLLNAPTLLLSARKGSGGGSSYTNLGVQTGNYSVTDTGKLLVLADTSGGSITVTPNPNPKIGDRLRVVDHGKEAGDSIIDVIGLGVINTNGGMKEWFYDGAQWILIGAFENIFNRDSDNDAISTEELDVLITNTIRSGLDPNSYAQMSENGLEVFVQGVLALVATKNGLISPNGAIGAQAATHTTEYGEFENVGMALDGDGTSRGNIITFSDENLADTLNLPEANFNHSADTDAQAKSNLTDPYTGPAGGHNWSLGQTVEVDLGEQYVVGGINVKIANTVATMTLRGSNTSMTGPWSDIGTTPSIPIGPAEQYDFQNTTPFRYYQVERNGASGGANAVVNLREAAYASSTNTLDTEDLGSITIAPANTEVRDENGDPIMGAGKVNIEWTTTGIFPDQGPEDLDTFLERTSNIPSFVRARLQPIDGQRISEIDLAGPSAQWMVDGSGLKYLVDGMELFSFTSDGLLKLITKESHINGGANLLSDGNEGLIFYVSPDQDFVFETPTNIQKNTTYTWYFTNDTTPRAISSFGNNIWFSNGVSFDLTQEAGAFDMVTGISPDGTNIILTMLANAKEPA